MTKTPLRALPLQIAYRATEAVERFAFDRNMGRTLDACFATLCWLDRVWVSWRLPVEDFSGFDDLEQVEDYGQPTD